MMIGSGYTSLAEQLISFNEISRMPINVDIKKLDNGSGIEATLAKHCAGWHKSCRLKFSQTKLERLKKQLNDEKVSTPPSVNTRSCHTTIDLKDDKFFLCNDPGGSEGLHNASTYKYTNVQWL